MFTYYYCGDNEIVKLISFAGTLASIILSVIAIFMTILSNDSLGSLLNNVSSVSDSLKQLPMSIDESVKKLNNASSMIETSVNEMRDNLHRLETKIMHVDDEISETKAKIDDLKEKSSSKQENTSSQDSGNKQVVTDVISNSSYFGLILMYSICMAASRETTFKLSDLSRISRCTEEYMYGYAVALSTAGIASLEIDSSTVTVESISKYLNITDVLNRLKFVSLKLATDNNIQETLDSELKEIEKMFSVEDDSTKID